MIISAFIPVIDNPRNFVRGQGVLSELHKCSDVPIDLKIYTESRGVVAEDDKEKKKTAPMLFEGNMDFDIRVLKGYRRLSFC